MSYLFWLSVLVIGRYLLSYIPKKEDKVSEAWMKNYIYTSGKEKF